MKTGIHPTYNAIKISCACGAVFTTGSTLKDDQVIEICKACHPFYTGKQKIVDTTGVVDKFLKRKQVGEERKAVKPVKKERKTRTTTKPF